MGQCSGTNNDGSMFVFGKARVVNGELVVTDKKLIDQSKLTADCWLIQFNGIAACKTCDLKNTSECGGGETLKGLKRQRKTR